MSHIRKTYRTLCFFLTSLIQVFIVFSQSSNSYKNIIFYHLTTAQGLSDNYVRDMGMDKTGNLWIGTQDGLNMFNGRSISWFLRENHPQLNSDYITRLFCDEQNRVWVLCQGGYPVLIDENRKFHKISLYNNRKLTPLRWLLDSKEYGAILFTKDGFFTLSKSKNVLNQDSLSNDFFMQLKIEGMDTLQARKFSQIEPFDENRYILSIEDGFFIIDFKEKRVSKKYSFPNLYILDKWLPDELLAYDKIDLELRSINLKTQQVSWPLRGVKDQHGKPLTAKIINVRMINGESLLLSTYMEGLYLYNLKSKMLTNYRHNAADPTTIINDLPRVLKLGNDGWVFIAAAPNGLSYFKSNAVIGGQTVFMDKKGNSYDGYVSCIATLDNSNFYIGVGNNLLKWNRNTNTTEFVDYAEVGGKKLMHNENVNHIEIDPMGRLWIVSLTNGVFVLGKNDKAIKHLRYEGKKNKGLPAKRMYDIKRGPDNFMWQPTDSGIVRVDPRTYQIDYLENLALRKLKATACNVLFFSDSNNLWIGTVNKGVWHYSFITDSLRNFNMENGFIGNYILAINQDNNGNIYIGTDKGLQIFLANGKIKRITQADGLMHPRAEVLILDRRNRMWIGNDVGIACFNIADSSLRFFDETYGLSIQGFRVSSYWQTSEDEQVWGTERGIQYFYPDDLYNYKADLKVTINRLESRNVVTNITQSNTYELAANDNYVTFYFSTIEYLAQLRTFYEYKLEGVDKDWIKVVNQNSVRYSALPQGKYTFKVRASNDDKVWYDAENEITIMIASHFYNTWWFKVLASLLAAGLIWYVITYYRKKQQKQTEELENELVINYFASQINRHQKTEDILWDVARNCISKLKFEDCVIYLLDEERKVLVQKAAWGPKLAKDFAIYQPIEISVGEGIVGSVALSGKPELIANTELDKRYIADDARRFSELAVPLIIGNKVIGVIDSEHSRRNFFTKRHLNILSTVAVLCATQIERAKAEQEELEAQLVINYFASQIHSRFKTDDLLWDVARNLIGKMGFEDCMIYLWNDDKTVLVQKAGYGSKGSMEEIMDRTAYHIPKGKGIVGAAVESKQSLLVNDTSKDKRYFTADEKIMLSELCAPLVHDNEVLGAINIEHHRKNFFTQKHLKMLSTIAALCASQIKRIRAEEEKQQARIEALQNKQKAIETRLQSLRLQMNPHFLFNALNSVQQMILANEEMVATRYLSKFSKLLRTILVHSDKEFVTLKEELEILNLYIDLESMRFKDSFKYEIECDDGIDTDEIKLPTLLIQPFVENAIWHGLMHKEGERLLQVK
ncbi:MAG TPA: GAF domain-containing protein, partial [Chitinophagaceae bacterium]|nr:GAF domain-containing protein [Chitinophagaceae bacterium]